MTLVSRGGGEYVDSEPIEDCVPLEAMTGNQVEALRDYLLPRLEKSRDKVSKFILEEMDVTWDGDLGKAVLDAVEHFSPKEVEQVSKWVEEAQGANVYAYVDVDAFNVSYGLMRTTGGPEDSIVSYKKVGGYESSDGSFAPYWEFADALKEIEGRAGSHGPRSLRGAGASMYLTPEMEKESRRAEEERRRQLSYLFAENPLVEVTDEGDYDEALSALGFDAAEGSWEGPGLYNFDDSPPTYASTLEDYEREALKDEAERALEMMWDEDLEGACSALLEE
jgi:hypothetical protein